MFNSEIPPPIKTSEEVVPHIANDNEQFDEGEEELLKLINGELEKIDLTLEDEMLRTAFQFRIQALVNENAQANRHLIEELARAHQIIEAQRMATKKREQFKVAATAVSSVIPN